MSRLLRRLALAALVLVTVLIVLVWQFPASLLLARLPEAARAHLRIERATGTLWRGEALFASPWLAANQRLAWRCAPEWRLRLSCTLEGALEGRFTLEPSGRVSGEGLRALVPVQVRLHGTPRASADRVEVSVERLAFDRRRLHLNGSLVVQGLMLALAPDRAQGISEVTADCRPEGEATRCAVQSRGEPAPVSGIVEMNPSRVRGQLQLNLPGQPSQTLAW